MPKKTRLQPYVKTAAHIPTPAVVVDPAIRQTRVAKQMREYYEINRPHWWGAGPPSDGLPDVLMLGLLHIVLTEYK